MKTSTIINDGNTISNGLHYLSGIGDTTIDDGWGNGGMYDAKVFCIDNQNYCVYNDKDDGFRSYGKIIPTEAKCQYTFEPQPVIAVNKRIVNCEDGWDTSNTRKLVLLDAINNQIVLEIGTDYGDNMYPFAIFNYSPQNLEVNKGK